MPDNIEETLHDSLASAFETAEAAVEPIEPPVEAAKPERARSEDGKFAKVETPAIEAPVVEAKTAAPIVPAEVIPAAPAQAEFPGSTGRAPSSWKKDAAAAFDTLPTAVKEDILRRETDFHKGIEGFKARADFGKQVEQTLSPFAENFAKAGVDSMTAISEIMKTEDILRNAPPTVKLQKFLQLAQHYGIDLNQQVDPNVARYEAENHQLRQEQRELMRMNTSRESESLNSTIEDFANQPGHEHFESVRQHMGALMAGGQAATLQEAYDQAIYANPTTRTVLLQQQQSKLQDEINAKRAKAASVSVRGSSPSSGAANQPKTSLRDEIVAAFNQ